ncbi:chondrolectin [Pseudoliparis swirei]|uniref:chondrolectin n=1 Tax=Pseudoliparis swirei TaxID=2059687 RepID=UPI0024BD6C75|nr:chondrolectin [Pseudoliparis swirei]
MDALKKAPKCSPKFLTHGHVKSMPPDLCGQTGVAVVGEALQACRLDGGSLLSIGGPEEQSAIEELLQELRSGAVGGAGGGAADGDFWIGLTRLDGADETRPQLSNTVTSCPQRYRWTDGSPAPFRNWYFDEPSCGGEACVVMYHQPTALPGLGGAYLYQWNDDRCNMKHNFICKYEPESHLVKEQGHTPGGWSPAVYTYLSVSQ